MAPCPVLPDGRRGRRPTRPHRPLRAFGRLAHGAPPRLMDGARAARGGRPRLGGAPGIALERHQRRDEPAVVLGHLHRADALGRELHRGSRLPGDHPRGRRRRRGEGVRGPGRGVRRRHRVLLRPRLRHRRPADLGNRDAAFGLPGHLAGPGRVFVRAHRRAGRAAGREGFGLRDRRRAGRQAVAFRARLLRVLRPGHCGLRAVPRPGCGRGPRRPVLGRLRDRRRGRRAGLRHRRHDGPGGEGPGAPGRRGRDVRLRGRHRPARAHVRPRPPDTSTCSPTPFPASC